MLKNSHNWSTVRLFLLSLFLCACASSLPMPHPPQTIGQVTSKDGTRIRYRQLGRGPGILVLHGVMESSQSHQQLAEALADSFTVYLPDRRGRGLSGAYGPAHCLQREVEDVDALLAHTGAHYVFGVSLGAIVALQAARHLSAVHRVAIYEPPLFVDRPLPTALLARYEAEMGQGHTAAALVAAMQAAQLGPPFLNALPHWLLETMTRAMLNRQDRQAGAGEVTMRMLAPTLHQEFQVVAEVNPNIGHFAGIPVPVRLLGGSQSPAYLQAALGKLASVLPHATRHTFPGLGHGGSGNADQRGKPDLVAQDLRQFFATGP